MLAEFICIPQQFPVAHWLFEVQTAPEAQLLPEHVVDVKLGRLISINNYKIY